jgi:hypothetical protein
MPPKDTKNKMPQVVINARTRRLVQTALSATLEVRDWLNKLVNDTNYNDVLPSAVLKNLGARVSIKEFARDTGLFTEKELNEL